MKIKKIISGGQTGVDCAALDVAIDYNIPHGGWCPKNRIAEDGNIPVRYNLQETSSTKYEVRTKMNVRDADGTLIVIKNPPPASGTLLTIKTAINLKKPCLIFNVATDDKVDIIKWAEANKIKILNIAGPRESQTLGIYKCTYDLLKKIFMLQVAIHDLNSR